MCTDCGCAVTDGHFHAHEHAGEAHAGQRHDHGADEVLNSLLANNDRLARANRALLDAKGILAINLMSSPGSGKTALLEATIRALPRSLRIAVIEGDLETENDAERIRALGVPAQQITTGTACHLDAHLVAHALADLDQAIKLDGIDILFIENVGNLVCPASFDLGHHRNVILLSTTEGDDKPAKYPVMFRAADLMLVSKTDLLPWLADFSPARAEARLRALASSAPVLQVAAPTGAGIADWIDWLLATRDEYRRRRASGETLTPGPRARNAAASTDNSGSAPALSFVAAAGH